MPGAVPVAHGSVLGFGAFRIPPGCMAEPFEEVFRELDFDGRFPVIALAIVDDHDSRRDHNAVGNFLSFPLGLG